MTRRIDTIALAIGVVLLALGPLVLTLARADSYQSTTYVSLDPHNPSAARLENPVAFVKDPLKVKDVQRHISSDVPWLENSRDVPNYVRVSDAGGRRFAVTARGPGPDEARQLAEVAAAQVRGAAQSSAAFTQPLEIQRLRSALRGEDLTASRRAELRAQLDETKASLAGKRDLFAREVPPGTVQSEKFGDRVLGALPGDRAFRPNLIWVTVAGFTLAGALALWALALAPMRSGRDRSAPG